MMLAERCLCAVTLGTALTLGACSKRPHEDAPAATVRAPSDAGPPGLSNVGVLNPALESSGADAGDAPVLVTFDWSPPCHVPALYEVTKDGHVARMRVTVSLEPGSDGFTLSLDGMTVVRMDDNDATRPELAHALAPATLLMTSLPQGRISAKGVFLGTRDIDAYAEHLATSLEASSAPELRDLAPLSRLPAVKVTMEQDIRNLWESWVEDWLSFSIAPGGEKMTMTRTEVAGHAVSLPVLQEHLGAVRGVPELALLSMRESLQGNQVPALFGGQSAEQIARAARLPLADDAASSVRVERTNLVALDPTHARPHRARFETRILVPGASSVDTRDTVFDWDHATGCGLSPR